MISAQLSLHFREGEVKTSRVKIKTLTLDPWIHDPWVLKKTEKIEKIFKTRLTL